ncbi:TolB family protein [Microterricola viridarii]|uniref:TolB family protein n=1 Tax=Microterricola viridarii TaxID=412690 RepID=UPI001E3081AE|nr:hypothetical protein [Microterricola viridarii]
MLIVAAVGVLLFGGAGTYGVLAYQDYQQRSSAPSAVDATDAPLGIPDGQHIAFRNTASGQGYGLLAFVPVDAPSGPRNLTDIACDRVAANTDVVSCLHTDRGITTTFGAALYDASLQRLRESPLAGIPSRTRLSPDGTLVATTAFVTGHNYATVGFSTQTTIHTVAGEDLGNLENFDIVVNDAPLLAADRNIWGVTFSADNNTFYATVASGGATWLALGNLTTRTMTAIAKTAECPSLSPDGASIAYKKRVSDTPSPFWAIAVRSVSTGEEIVLPEARSVDDQIEWLDNRMLLYGMPRDGSPGDYDVWAISADGAGAAQLFIEHAWSPSVLR